MPSLPVRTILFLASNPKDTDPLRLDEELREIDEGLRRARQRDQFKLDQKWAVRAEDLRRSLLDEQPTVVHFSGHGTPLDGIIVEDRAGNAEPINPRALAGLFKLFADQVDCVVLNACYSEEQAAAISQHIKYVVGMTTAIGDKAAIEFAVGFYDALGAGRSYEDAFEFGCNAIAARNIPEDLTPQLKIRADVAEVAKQKPPIVAETRPTTAAEIPPVTSSERTSPSTPASHAWSMKSLIFLIVGVLALLAAGWGYYQKTYWDEQAATYEAAAQKQDLLAWDDYLAQSPDPYYAQKAEAEKARLIPLKQAESEEAFAKTREMGSVDAWLSYLTAFQSYSKYVPADRLAFAERMINECGGVDFSGPYSSGTFGNLAVGPNAAWWCASPGATLTINQQRFAGSCGGYTAEFGALHQNTLGRRAIWRAKDGDDAGASRDIEACQCHNVPAQQQIAQPEENRRMICWLRIQPRPQPKPEGL